MAETHPHTMFRNTLSNVILGVADGMVVSLAFLTGISLNTGNLKFTILAGVASIAASAISMFFSGILAAHTEIDLYNSDYKRELYEIETEPGEEKQELIELYVKKGLSTSEAKSVVSKIIKDKARWLEDLLLNELHVHKDSLSSPLQAGLSIGIAALIGGLIPLIPYAFFGSLHTAIAVSIIISLASLLVIGSIKGKIAKRNAIISGGEVLLIGILATLVVYGIGKLLIFA